MPRVYNTLTNEFDDDFLGNHIIAFNVPNYGADRSLLVSPRCAGVWLRGLEKIGRSVTSEHERKKIYVTRQV